MRDGAYSDDRSQIQSFIKINSMFGKLKLLLEFIFGFELFQDNEILRTAGKFEFAGESVLNKFKAQTLRTKIKDTILLPTW